MFLLASDLNAVPAEFIKNFAILLVTAGGMYFAYLRGKRVHGTQDDPVNVAQPLVVKHQEQFAHRHDLEGMRQKVEDLMTAGAERRVEILNAIHGGEQRLLVEIKELHERLNPVAESCKAHAALLEKFDRQWTQHEQIRMQETQRIHARIDDAIRLSTQPKPKG